LPVLPTCKRLKYISVSKLKRNINHYLPKTSSCSYDIL